MKIGVYGLGRFGRFWASLLAGEQGRVYGYSRSPKKDLPEEIVPVDEAEILQVDALFLCVSISAFEEVIRGIAPRLRKGTVVFDTCSVKSYPAEVMDTYLGDQIESIATHPMFGPDSGRDGVEGLPMVMSPVRSSTRTFEYWRDFFARLGPQVLELSPDEHDHQAAYTQGVTHFIGRVLQGMHLEESPIATTGYNKLLEIIEQTCNDPIQLFHDLQRFNPYTGEMRNSLFESFQRTLEMLEDDLRQGRPGEAG